VSELILQDQTIEFAKLVVAAGWEWCGLQEAIPPAPPVLIIQKWGVIKRIPVDPENFDPVKTATLYIPPLEKKMTDKPKLNLRQKLVQIYKNLDHVAKAGENKKQGYNFVRAADVLRAIRDEFATLGIYAETNFEYLGSYDIKTNSGGNMHTATVKATLKLYDCDSDETKVISGLGDGADGGDKGIYKAQTGAVKNALRNGTLLPDEGDPNGGDPEGDQNVDEQTTGNYSHNSSTTAIPDFHEAQHASPKPNPAPKAQKPTEAPKTAPVKPEPVPLPQTSMTPAVAQASIAAPENVPGKGDAYEGPEDTTLPTEAELVEYRARFKTLADDLSTAGKLKTSRGLPINRKLLVFLISITKAADAKNISKSQWDNFFSRVDAAKSNEAVGLIGLAKLVNKANGLDEKK
jgi:hypothetical protein